MTDEIDPAEELLKNLKKPEVSEAVRVFLALGTEGPGENVCAGAILAAVVSELGRFHQKKSGGDPAEWSALIFDLSTCVHLIAMASEPGEPHVMAKGGDA